FALNEEGKFIIEDTVIEDETAPLPEGYEIIDGVLQVTLEDELAPIDLELLKIDSMNSRRLEGAEFSIEKQNSAGEYEIIEGGLAPDPNDSSLFNASDLLEGVYRIKEVKSPDSYRKLPGYFILEISYREEPDIENDRVVPGKEAGTLKVEISYYPNEEAETPDLQQELEYELLETNRIRLQLSVGNDPENPLPATGGSGRLFYILLAAFFMALAGAAYGLFVRQSKKEGAR
ncbi:VWA domain-containing protein, partial [Acinetobacter baumannii]|nr:VWA domain-containing protein [Acinetobacter baumannii]